MKKMTFHRLMSLLGVLAVFSAWSWFSACSKDPNQVPCEAASKRVCRCVGPTVEGKQECYFGEQVCKADGKGYDPCSCGAGAGAGSGSGSGSSSNTTDQKIVIPCEGEIDPNAGKPKFEKIKGEGFEATSDVVSHVKVAQDIGDIALLFGQSPVDYVAVKKLYAEGKNSVKGDGSVRTIGGFASTGANFSTYAPEAVTYFGGDATFLHAFLASAMDGSGDFQGASDAVRGAAITHGLLVVMHYWVILEFGKTEEKAAKNELDPIGGAPHNWDEAFVFYWGPQGQHSLYALAKSLATRYGLKEDINQAFFGHLIAGQKKMVTDKAAPTEDTKGAMKQLDRLFLLALIDAASRVDAMGDAAAKKEHQAAARALWFAVGHVVAKADKAAATAIEGVLKGEPQEKTADVVKDSLKKVLSTIGLTTEDFGTALQ